NAVGAGVLFVTLQDAETTRAAAAIVFFFQEYFPSCPVERSGICDPGNIREPADSRGGFFSSGKQCHLQIWRFRNRVQSIVWEQPDHVGGNQMVFHKGLCLAAFWTMFNYQRGTAPIQ